ncbi:transcription factor bHLH52 [Mangifera indica]|uniref:transcription factor bHLH52 n=1 Tax=Mangifera indica TaxID=29780 RepID=UPI001CFBFF93|nr:transcription factor bHLH52 [Mangifera indica]
MALSLWDQSSDLHHYFNNPEMFSFQHQAAENDDELDCYFNLFSFSNNGVDFTYDYASDTFPDNNYNQFPFFFNNDNQLYHSDSDDLVFPFEDFQCNQNFPKRQKSCYYGDGLEVDHNSVTFSSEFFVNPPPPLLLPEFLPEIPAPPLAAFSLGKSSSCSRSDTDPESGAAEKANTVSLSAQSIAARERRRKITEKTQELGKLIPGGHRMNTAEMFQAAAKYVKFLQAQVKVLQLMEPSMQERAELLPFQELQTLLESPIIQEKLYSEEKCLVPRQILQTLKKDPEIQSKPAIFESIDQLISGD